MDERLIQKTPIVEKVNQSEGVTNMERDKNRNLLD